MVWGTDTVTLQTWDHTTETPTLVLSERFDFDKGGRLIRKYLPNSTTIFTEYVYCKAANEPTACGGDKNRNKLRRTLYPDGSQVEYTYDAKGRLLSTSHGSQP